MIKKTPIKAPQPLVAPTPIQIYLREITKYPLLDQEEEQRLARNFYEQGESAAAHKLITSNLRLVVKIANDFRKAQVDLLDLIQEGNRGLMQAVRRFNPYKGVKLSSYAAWWIRAYILKYLMDHSSQVKIATTASQRKLYYNLQKETERLLKLHDQVDTKLLSETLAVPERDVVSMQGRLNRPDLSLDVEVSDEPDGPLRRDLLPADEEDNVEESVAKAQIRGLFLKSLEEFRKTLQGRDQDIFETRLMNENPVTLQEIGNKYGISRERARQLESRIFKKLKEFIKNQKTLDL